MDSKNYQSFSHLKERLQQKTANVAERPVLYVAFGDSVTQGWMEFATMDHNGSFPALFKKRVDARFPLASLNLINAGVSGDTAVRSLSRVERDLLPFGPDLVTIGFGVNDAHQGMDGIVGYCRALTEIIERIRERGHSDILLVTPSMMMRDENTQIHENDKKHVNAFVAVAQSGVLPLYRQAMLEVASETYTPCLDAYALWLEMEHAGVDIHSRLANGINHPDRAFHNQLAEKMEQIVFPM
jgi:lysophospholipase L1-like esterase